ncbi:MAG TPA: protein kinase, partial [Kofleriaceae bacterium]|nr:protein kinase [Kofleriaceae bacterium]
MTGYMSPGQMRASRNVDERSDEWAFGIVRYELLTGRRPFVGESSLAIAMLVATQSVPPMECWVKKRLQSVVLKRLE